MTGLSVLYTKNLGNWSKGSATIQDRDLPGKLREAYWANCVKSESGRKSFINVTLNSKGLGPDIPDIGRESDDPGDVFLFEAEFSPKARCQFEWVEVTEVFTTVEARQINAAMRDYNNIPNKFPFDFNAFLASVPRIRPSCKEQRIASDRVIKQIEKKLSKSSYVELVEKYGYGTLVVGMPLWFATPPLNPFRAENAIDDFITRTRLALKDIKRKVLRRRDCPFKKIIVVWDTTPEAMYEWRDRRSVEYEDATKLSLMSAISAKILDVYADGILEEKASELKIPDNDLPSLRFTIDIKTRKTISVKGPYPEIVEAIGDALSELNQNPVSLRKRLLLRLMPTLFNLLYLLKTYKLDGLKRWIVRKFSVRDAWQLMIFRLRARRFYYASKSKDDSKSDNSSLSGVPSQRK